MYVRLERPAGEARRRSRAEDCEARRVHVDRERPHPPERVDDAVYVGWTIHIAPDRAVAEVERAADDVTDANRRLNEAVVFARAAGASIGDAVGISRQAANERWGRR
ncbi:hypothetical protein [Jiangella gansuensis]|uniref:hypothetical protein n=1 Tax=Jiangella gansuensis TaxID=281473 RepID=UPI0004BCA26A|nr:hypothetical protein [Jiangella gansuensis]